MVSDLQRLAPGLLIAAPALRDPNFSRTVVLMCVHGEDGAMGLVINRPTPFSIAEIMAQMDVECDVDLSQKALVGGPVAMENGLLLYRADASCEVRDDELEIGEGLRLCPSREVLQAIGKGQGPKEHHMFLGHAGWAAGQLEQEIAQAAWVPATLRLELIFSVPLEARWTEALRGEGLHLAQMSTYRPQA